MRNKIFYFLIALFLTGISTTSASHLAGGDLTYEWQQGNTFKFTANVIYDCGQGSQSPEQTITISIHNGSTFVANITGQKVNEFLLPTNNCIMAPECDDNVPAGIQPPYLQSIYEVSYTFPSASTNWIISYDISVRNHDITTGSAQTVMYIQASLNNQAAPQNNSPVFNNNAQLALCVGNTNNFNHGVTEADGDELVYSITTPLVNSGSGVNYNPPFSVNMPFTGTYTTSPTGQISFTPTIVGQITPLATLVEEYNTSGVLIGTVMRDFQITTLACNNLPPEATPTTATIDVCVSETVQFDITGSDPDAGDLVTMTWNNGIPGGTFNVLGNGTANPVGTFSWAPTTTGMYSFTVTVTDDACPQSASQTYDYFVNVTTCNPCDTVQNVPGFTYKLVYTATGADLIFTDVSTSSADDFPYIRVIWGDFSMAEVLPAGSTYTHHYDNYGTYTVCVVMYTFIDDICCHQAVCIPVEILPPTCDDIDVDFTIKNPFPCSGDNDCCVEVNLVLPPPYIYTDAVWDWGDGTLPWDTGHNATHKYTSNGWKTITMYISIHPPWDPQLCCYYQIQRRVCITGCTANPGPVGPTTTGPVTSGPMIPIANGGGMTPIQINNVPIESGPILIGTTPIGGGQPISNGGAMTGATMTPTVPISSTIITAEQIACPYAYWSPANHQLTQTEFVESISKGIKINKPVNGSYLRAVPSNDFTNSIGIAAFPNPANDLVKFDIQSEDQLDGQVVIYNVEGVTLFEVAASTNTIIELSTARLANGIYFYGFNSDQLTSVRQKLVIVR